jgi:hypothetical protein
MLFISHNYRGTASLANFLRQSSLFVLCCLVIYSTRLSPAKACSVHLCSNEYGGNVVGQQQALRMASVRTKSVRQLRRDRDQYCSLMKAYATCMQSMTKTCRGNLEYHTVSTLLKNWIASDCISRFASNYAPRTLQKQVDAYQSHGQPRSSRPLPPLATGMRDTFRSSVTSHEQITDKPKRRNPVEKRQREERKKEKRRQAQRERKDAQKSGENVPANLASRISTLKYNNIIFATIFIFITKFCAF